MLVDVLSSIQQISIERLGQEYTPPRWDNRSNKNHHKFSNFRCKTIREAVQIDNDKSPNCVDWAVESKAHRTIGDGSHQSSSCSFDTGRFGNVVHKRLPQLSEVKEIHAHMTESGKELKLCEENSLLALYVRCGSIVDARHVFENMRKRNLMSWSVMIQGYSKQGEGVLVLELYVRMHQEGVQPTDRTFVAVLKACSSLAAQEKGLQVHRKFLKIGYLEMGRAIHSQVMKNSCESDVFVGTTLVDLYIKCGSMEDARHVFGELHQRNVVSWNAMILGHAQREEGALALELYVQMHQEGVEPSDRTFVGALMACTSLASMEEKQQLHGPIGKIGCLEKGRNLHSQVVKHGFESDIFVGNTLVDMYMKCGSMEDARQVFKMLLHRTVVSWNTMILGHVFKEEGALALELYEQMHEEGVRPNDRTYVMALKACSTLAACEVGMEADGKFVKIEWLEKVRAIHSQVEKSGFESDIFVGTTLVDVYIKCGSMEDARHVFDKLRHRDVVSWTAMISGYAQQEEGALALELYTCMYQESVIPYDRTFVGSLNACSSLAALEEAKQVDGKSIKLMSLEKGRAIHSQAVKSGFELDVFVGTALVDMYANCGSMKDAWHVFDILPYRDVVSWNAMISGNAEQKENEEALKLYARMQEQGLTASIVTFASVLKACGNAAALETGKELHAQICELGMETTAMITNTLIDMYAKCGSMVDAKQLFDALPTRDLVTWNALIAGYGHQGESGLVFDLFERMRQEAIQPDGVTFLGVLTACSHAGLVNKGQMYFQAMSKEHGIIPSLEHYTCMIGLLGRTGQVEEAVSMIKKIPCQPDVVSWVAVLGACQKWNKVEIGRHAFEHAVTLDDKNAAAYVLMSNIHARDQI